MAPLKQGGKVTFAARLCGVRAPADGMEPGQEVSELPASNDWQSLEGLPVFQASDYVLPNGTCARAVRFVCSDRSSKPGLRVEMETEDLKSYEASVPWSQLTRDFPMPESTSLPPAEVLSYLAPAVLQALRLETGRDPRKMELVVLTSSPAAVAESQRHDVLTKIRPDRKGARSRIVRRLGSLNDGGTQGGGEDGEAGEDGEDGDGGELGKTMRLTMGGRRKAAGKVQGSQAWAMERLTLLGRQFQVSVYPLGAGAGVMVLARDMSREERMDHEMAIERSTLTSLGFNSLVTNNAISKAASPKQQEDARKLVKMVALVKSPHHGVELVLQQPPEHLRSRNGSLAGLGVSGRRLKGEATSAAPSSRGSRRNLSGNFDIDTAPKTPTATSARLEPLRITPSKGSRHIILLHLNRQYGAFEFDVEIEMEGEALLVHVENRSQGKKHTSTVAGPQLQAVLFHDGRSLHQLSLSEQQVVAQRVFESIHKRLSLLSGNSVTGTATDDKADLSSRARANSSAERMPAKAVAAESSSGGDHAKLEHDDRSLTAQRTAPTMSTTAPTTTTTTAITTTTSDKRPTTASEAAKDARERQVNDEASVAALASQPEGAHPLLQEVLDKPGIGLCHFRLWQSGPNGIRVDALPQKDRRHPMSAFSSITSLTIPDAAPATLSPGERVLRCQQIVQALQVVPGSSAILFSLEMPKEEHRPRQQQQQQQQQQQPRGRVAQPAIVEPPKKKKGVPQHRGGNGETDERIPAQEMWPALEEVWKDLTNLEATYKSPAGHRFRGGSTSRGGTTGVMAPLLAEPHTSLTQEEDERPQVVQGKRGGRPGVGDPRKAQGATSPRGGGGMALQRLQQPHDIGGRGPGNDIGARQAEPLHARGRNLNDRVQAPQLARQNKNEYQRPRGREEDRDRGPQEQSRPRQALQRWPPDRRK